MSRLSNPYSKWEQVCSFHFKKKYIKKPAIEIHAGFFDIEVGQKLILVPPKLDFPRSCEITHIYQKDGDVLVCAINSEDSVKFYENLDGMYGLAPRGEVRHIVPSIDYDFANWKLIDNTSNATYKIVECESMPTQVLLHAMPESGDEILIPLIEDFIIDIDVENKSLVCEFPFIVDDL